MAKKMKLDTQKLKQFLMDKGEVVAVGVAGSIALLLFVVGVAMAFSTGSPVADSKKIVENLDRSFKSATPAGLTFSGGNDPEKKDGPGGPKEIPITWPTIPVDRFPTVAWYSTFSDTSPKKRNPAVRPIDFQSAEMDRDTRERKRLNHMQMDVIVGGVKVYDVKDKNIETLEKGGRLEPAHHVRAQRMVVVAFTFPYRAGERAPQGSPHGRQQGGGAFRQGPRPHF